MGMAGMSLLDFDLSFFDFIMTLADSKARYNFVPERPSSSALLLFIVLRFEGSALQATGGGRTIKSLEGV